MIKRPRTRPNGMNPNNNMRMQRPQSSNSHSNQGGDDRNDVRLKNRNYYQQMNEKYSNMAREALRSGDRIEAEGFFQYAEHYLRQLNERIRYENEQQLANQQRQQARDQNRNRDQRPTQPAVDGTEVQPQTNPVRTPNHHHQNTRNQQPKAADDTNENPSVETPVTNTDNESTDDNRSNQRRRGPRMFYKRNRPNEGEQQNDTNVAPIESANVSNHAPNKVDVAPDAPVAAPKRAYTRKPRVAAAPDAAVSQ